MIIEHLLDDNNLTNTEKSIAQFLLNKDQKINNLTSSELGKQSYTSQAAVTRLYKKLGFNNFREFLSTLILERNDYLKYNDLPTEHPEQYFTSLEDTEKVIASLYEKAMIQTNRLLDKNVVNRVCNRILSASFIDIYGIGLSYTIAKEMCFKLQSLGLPCSYQNGINIKYIDNMQQHQSNVSILITTTGDNNLIKEIAKILKNRNVYTVGILGKKGKDLIQLCHDYLLFDTSLFEDIDSLCATFSAEYVINILYATLLYRLELSNYMHYLK